ncbi:MAG: MATE family efflux transporter, partial [Clostridium sp.]|nr:MATE family efflux transporter [Clostridium sp.]
PAIMVYNFGAAILRAQGNTKQPLFYLACTGVINVILNLILVIGFHLDVAGVAIATLVSQVVSAILVIRYLVHQKGAFHLDIRKLRIDKTILGRILRVGIPAGLNNTVFSISNMQIQSSINLFGSAAIAVCSAATSIEGFVYAATNSMHQAGINFTGQNVGAGRRDRVPKILRLCLLYAGLFGLVLGFAVYGLGRPLLSLYTHETADIEYGMIRMAVLMLPYFLCGIMEAVAGVLRGLGYSVMPTVVTLVGACGFRIIWIQTIFKTWTSLEVLFLSFPISWVLTTIAHFIFYLVVTKKDRNML